MKSNGIRAVLLLLVMMTLIGIGTAVEFPLYAGQTEYVGVIDVILDGDEVQVNYELSPGCELMESHWNVENDYPVAARTNIWFIGRHMTITGNPIPGHLYYSDGDWANVDDWDPMFIAAHGVVECCEIEEPVLPEYLDIEWKPGATSYFDVMFSDTDGGSIPLDSWVEAWCADSGQFINNEGTCEDVSFAFVEDGCINYLLNYGDMSDVEDFQDAIWYFTNGGTPNDIANDAIAADCENFEPECGEYIGVFVDIPCLDTEEQVVQPMFIMLEIPCGDCFSETAWAADGEPLEQQFPGRNWATYIEFNPVA